MLMMPEYWNKGIGSYFMNRGLNGLKNSGYKKLVYGFLKRILMQENFTKKWVLSMIIQNRNYFRKENDKTSI